MCCANENIVSKHTHMVCTLLAKAFVLTQLQQTSPHYPFLVFPWLGPPIPERAAEQATVFLLQWHALAPPPPCHRASPQKKKETRGPNRLKTLLVFVTPVDLQHQKTFVPCTV